MLREQYRAAVERVGSWPERLERIANLDERLAGHLMTLQCRGELDYGSELFALFYREHKLACLIFHFLVCKDSYREISVGGHRGARCLGGRLCP